MVPITGAGVEATTELVSMWVGQRTGVWERLAPIVASLLPVALHTGDWCGGWPRPSTGKIHALLCIGSFYSKIGII